MSAILIGFLAGYLSGHFGLGGGLITTPAIRLILGYPSFIAVGTPLLVNIPTALSGAYVYNKSGFVDKFIAVRLMITGAAGAVIGSYLTSYFSGGFILFLTSIVILILGIRFPFNVGKKKIGEISGFTVLISGLAIGIASGFLGLGGGFLLVPFLTLVAGKDIKTSFGTSLAVISTITIPAALVHYVLGHVDLTLAAYLLIGVIPGAWIGAKVAIGLPERLLRFLFAALLITLAIYLGYYELVRLVS